MEFMGLGRLWEREVLVEGDVMGAITHSVG
jgi:hypothetical protein